MYGILIKDIEIGVKYKTNLNNSTYEVITHINRKGKSQCKIYNDDGTFIMRDSYDKKLASTFEVYPI